ncbi:MAG TPA: metalloregulator ArsR/SmtB family transcription factor [Microlunatus sp.]|nr:metalloregulator ArsR/SmtB family transcription factor [Microlunatus sp.]
MDDSPAIAGPQRPLYEVKANLFKGLSHPVRIRTLEILSAAAHEAQAEGGSAGSGTDESGTDESGSTDLVGWVPVSVMMDDMQLEASHLSQHLAVLRRHHLVRSERRGSQVFYALAYPQVADLLAVARTLLRQILETTHEQLLDTATLPRLPGPIS